MSKSFLPKYFTSVIIKQYILCYFPLKVLKALKLYIKWYNVPIVLKT